MKRTFRSRFAQLLFFLCCISVARIYAWQLYVWQQHLKARVVPPVQALWEWVPDSGMVAFVPLPFA